MLIDTRQTTSYNKNAVQFQNNDAGNVKKNFFTDMIASMTRVKFAPASDNYIFSRDYLSV